MKKEIIINATSDEIRVALIEDNKLAEIFLEVPDKERHVGSIYLGRVERVVQGMNAAFVGIGEAQDAFLHFSDVGTALDEFRDLLDERDDDEEEAEDTATAKPIPRKGAKSPPNRKADAGSTDDSRKRSPAKKAPPRKTEGAAGKGVSATSKKGDDKKSGTTNVPEKKPEPRKTTPPGIPSRTSRAATRDEEGAPPPSERKKPGSRKGSSKARREVDAPIEEESAVPEAETPVVAADSGDSESGSDTQKRKRRRGRRGGRNRRKHEEGAEGDDQSAVNDDVGDDGHEDSSDEQPDAGETGTPSDAAIDPGAGRKKRRRGRRGRGRSRRDESTLDTDEATTDAPEPVAKEPSGEKKKKSGDEDKKGRHSKRSAQASSSDEGPTPAEPAESLKGEETDPPAATSPAGKKGRTPRPTGKKTTKKPSETKSTPQPDEPAPEPPAEEKKKLPARKRQAKKKDQGSSTRDAKLPTFQTKRSGEVTIALEKGQDVIVQVTRESYASKGVRVSTKVSLPGRFLVLLPLDPAIGISRKVQNMKERRRLRRIARSILPEGHGCIIRTNAENKDEELIRQDLQQLVDKWQVIENKVKTADPPMLLYTDQSIANTVMRDLFTPDIERVVIDNRKLFSEIRDYVEWAAPGLAGKVELYQGSTPIFDKFGVEQELQRMFERKIYIPAGGYIILDQTEAMMVIDVNSGRYAGKKDQELNSLRTNLESAREIARQIRLRDIGGLLVIDFIDLYDEKNRKKVYDELKRELKKDRAKSVVLPMTQFGLVQMTRQRIRQQIVQTMSEPCPSCNGTGMVQSKATVLRNIERWLSRFREKSKEFRLTLAAHPLLIDYLTEGNPSRLTQVMVRHFVRLKVVPDESVPMGQFHFYSARRGIEITSEFLNNRKK